jgi:hypothetical protein
VRKAKVITWRGCKERERERDKERERERQRERETERERETLMVEQTPLFHPPSPLCE